MKQVFLGTILILILLMPKSFAENLETTESFCKKLLAKDSSADAIYKPGVDVNGKPVAPADLPASAAMVLPQKLNIPLTLQLAKVLNFNTSQYPFNQLGQGTEAQLGQLTLEGNQVFYNGNRLSQAQETALTTHCVDSNKSGSSK